MTVVAERPGTSQPTTDALHRRLGLTDEELAAIRDRLSGRDPNELELAMFSVMWSEHCSYKSSRPLLRTLPTGTAADGVVAGPGENAGVISIGDGLAVAFKIESHNHPSAVEPTQGAATGVGGILRDIFTMGARPIAVLDALRFGDPADPRTRHLVDGVVKGVGGYGNCVGVPTIGGELVFDPSYGGNPLVNVMAIGLLDERDLTRAAAPGLGNHVVLFGSTTGRDGIGGASVLASATFADADASKRPSVQVGDPFAEKLLIEASLELIRNGLVVGLQDLGAGGITCATSETADRAGTGMRIELAAIPRREPGMEPFEVMISESQERMLAIVEPDRWDAVRAVCERWGLPVALIGRVTADGDLTVVGDDGAELARIPAAALTSDAIVHERVASPPVRRRAAPAPGAPATASDGLPERGMDPGAVLVALLGSANLASRRAVFEQYDSTVQANTVEGPGHGAAVIRIKGTTKGLVAATDANQSVGALDPWLGAVLSVAEATRNVAITGARPLGVTNCLNYGDPTRPEAFWQLAEGVRGVGDACRALGVPVTGGNVSLVSPPRTVRPRSTSSRSAASRRSSARRPAAASSPRPRTSRAVGSPSRSPNAASGPTGPAPPRRAPRVSARWSGCRSRAHRPSTCSVRARRAWSCPRLGATSRRWFCWPASTACRSRSSGRSAGSARASSTRTPMHRRRASSSSCMAPVPPARPRIVAAASPTP